MKHHSVEGYTNLYNIIKEQNVDTKIILVLSAIAETTNLLIKFTETKDMENIISSVFKLHTHFQWVLIIIQN